MKNTALPQLLHKIYALKVKLDNMQNGIEKLRRDYYAACDMARTFIDNIEDNEIALGLRLHGINGLPWGETAALLGCTDIRKRCHDYLREGGKRNGIMDL